MGVAPETPYLHEMRKMADRPIADYISEQFKQGVTYGGSFEMENAMSDMTYSFGDAEQLDLFDDEDMREKYPALKQAWEHYQSVLEVCKTKEAEDED